MKEQGQFHDETEQHVEDIKAGSTAMLVAVRVRPLTQKEVGVDPTETVKVLDSKMIVMVEGGGEEGQRKGRNREAQFSYDFVYGKDANTKQIYDEALSGLLDGLLDGFNSTILAYGATGCGKTYTMIGEAGREGITALTMIDLLGRAGELRRLKNVIIRVSYIEIYNENIKDLLISEDRNLDLREDPKEGMLIPNVTEIAISSMLELATVLKVGAANRSKEATTANQASSRSHSLLLVKTQSRDKAQGVRQQTNVGKLSLVDLAGSERAGGQKGARQIQGAKINKSLLALGNCIQVLADSTSKGAFVPYRQSKLTRLLKESLGGNCRTALIVNVSPFSGNWEQSYNSLVYANRAKNIKTTACRNVLASEAHVSNYVALIGNLKRQNDELKKQLRGSKNHSLPQLKTPSLLESPEKLQIQRMQHRVDVHFGEELKMIQVISQLTMKLDKAGFKLCRLQLQRKEEKTNRRRPERAQKGEKGEGKLSKMIEEISAQKQQLQAKLEQLVFERGQLVGEIKAGEFSQNSTALLVAHYREKKVQIELQEIKLRQGRMQGEREEKQKLVGALGEQLKLRDRIIEEQRAIIQKNNIINRITYSKINAPLFPDVFQTITHAQSTLIPPESSQNPSIFQQKSPNKERQEEGSPKHSLSKRKRPAKNMWLQQSQQQGSFDRILKTEMEMPLEPKRSIPRGKVVRNKSKRKNAQLDFVYMQR